MNLGILGPAVVYLFSGLVLRAAIDRCDRDVLEACYGTLL